MNRRCLHERAARLATWPEPKPVHGTGESLPVRSSRSWKTSGVQDRSAGRPRLTHEYGYPSTTAPGGIWEPRLSEGHRPFFGQLGSSAGSDVANSGDSRASSRHHGAAARWLLFEELGSSPAGRCELLLNVAAVPQISSTGLLLNCMLPGPGSAWCTQRTSPGLSPGSNARLVGLAHSRSSQNPSEGRCSEGFRQGDGLRASPGLCRESPGRQLS